MRRITSVILMLMVLMAFSSAALAQEPAKYNFASAQANKEIRVAPGGGGSGVIYFYNIDGNQITHIVLEISQAPSNWEVAIQPPLGEIQVEINGRVVTVTENLHIEPSQALAEKVDTPPEGLLCISVPQRGYALAREAKMNVRVPDSEKVGTKSEVIVSATAQWLGQSGAVAIKQSRDFTFSVEVITAAAGGVEEKIVEERGIGEVIEKWLPWIIGAAVVLLGIVLILLYVRRRRD